MEIIKNVKKTITSIFMVPTLHISRTDMRDNGFINGYIKDEMNTNHYPNSIYLLFKPKDLDRFRDFLEAEYERTRQVIDDYDYPNGFVVVVYQLDSNWNEDFKLVRKGKYSKTSSAFQKEFPKTVNIIINSVNREEASLQYRIFNRTEDLVKFWENKFDVTFSDEQELWDGWQENNEILTEKELKSYE